MTSPSTSTPSTTLPKSPFSRRRHDIHVPNVPPPLPPRSPGIDSLDSETGSDASGTVSGPPRSPGLDLEGVVRRHDRDQLDNISYKETTDRNSLRRSSSASSNRSRRCSGEGSLLKEIVQLASLKETINSERCTREDLEQLISAKLAQCRVLFDFSCDPLSDLKYKVSSFCFLKSSHLFYFLVLLLVVYYS